MYWYQLNNWILKTETKKQKRNNSILSMYWLNSINMGVKRNEIESIISTEGPLHNNQG